MMADYHKAFGPELQAVIAATGIRPGMKVVDMACGDGSFSRWLAEAVGTRGEVVAADLSPAFLNQARAAVRNGSVQDRVQFLRMDLNHSPLADGFADLVWSAQSLQSLADPVEAVRRMAGLMRPNGRLAVFESDDLHHVALSWPVDLELAVRGAEFRSFKARSDEPRKFYVARDLPWVFREAGLSCSDVRGFAFTRRAPFDPSTRGFLEAYLADLRRRASPFLGRDDRIRFDRLVDPRSSSFLLDDPDALVVSVACLGLAHRPEE
jgi:SAM-dependent methyltransferase